MLNKKNRVNKSFFKGIIQKGSGFYGSVVSIKVVRTQNNKSHFAVSVPKKEVKTAVKRNLLKRRAYSAVKDSIAKIKPGFGVVIFLKKGAADIPYSKLKEEIVYLLKKAKIIEADSSD